MRKGVLPLGVLVAAGAVLVGASLAIAGGGSNGNGEVKATLSGYQEAPAAVSTTGKGQIQLKLDGTTISYKLSYEGLQGGNALFAHLHLGERHVAGGVIAFLCGGGGKPACPAGTSGEVEGTIVPTDVIGPAGQGIAAGEFEELVSAIRAGAVYANVHTPTWPPGEIRGQVKGGGHGKNGSGH